MSWELIGGFALSLATYVINKIRDRKQSKAAAGLAWVEKAANLAFAAVEKMAELGVIRKDSKVAEFEKKLRAMAEAAGLRLTTNQIAYAAQIAQLRAQIEKPGVK